MSAKEEESSENEEGERPVQRSQKIPQFTKQLPRSSRSSMSLKYINKKSTALNTYYIGPSNNQYGARNK